MKLVDYISKFISEGEMHTDNTQFVFPKDKSLKEKLPKWAPIFVSMLVKRACETEGEVKDCPEVIAASVKYRQSQDCIAGFITEKIVVDANGSFGKKMLNDVFKEWFTMHFGNRKPPKLSEIEEAVNNRFQHNKKDLKTNKWKGLKIITEEPQTDELDEIDNN
jgi:hypothetical protein